MLEQTWIPRFAMEAEINWTVRMSFQFERKFTHRFHADSLFKESMAHYWDCLGELFIKDKTPHLVMHTADPLDSVLVVDESNNLEREGYLYKYDKSTAGWFYPTPSS